MGCIPSCFRRTGQKPADEAVSASVNAKAATVADIVKELPVGPRICILGSMEFSDPATEALVTAVAQKLAGSLAGKAVFLTSAMPGVQAAFAKGFGPSESLINLLYAGQASDYGLGRDVSCGATLEEKRDIFGQLGQVYLSFEGGPAVAKMANVAVGRGALVLPMISTGGASGGMFNFPKAALEKPACATEAQWACLTGKVPPGDAATAVVDMISASITAKTATAADIAKELPVGPRICILGGQKFSDPTTEALVTAIAQKLAGSLAGKAVVLTGGMPGVQAAFAKGFGSSESLISLLPAGQASDYGVGRDVSCGATLEERMEIFGQLGQVYLTFEGGPGVAKEASAAFARGALVLPMISTGGASGGMFDFPKGALEKPACATEAQWACLTGKVPPEDAAAAVADMISASIQAKP